MSLEDVEFCELRSDLEKSLLADRGSRGSPGDADELFRAAVSRVIAGIRAQQRFQLLRRFIAHGSRPPNWGSAREDSDHALSDRELASCINFVSGHAVSKFQGALAEMLAIEPVGVLLRDLQKAGLIPESASWIAGERVRCVAARRGASSSSGVPRRVEGPDGLIASDLEAGLPRVHGIVEVKARYVSPSALHRQAQRHLAALRRGFSVDGRWIATSSEGQQESVVDPDVIRVFVLPTAWKLDTAFHFEPSDGCGRLVMDQPVVPPGSDSFEGLDARCWRVRLRWSREALRATAFRLCLGFMREVGEALERSPEPEHTLRTDMPAGKAGTNDFLLQLHVAIARQSEVEPDDLLRQKAIELFNVLAFGWALGHGFRDEEGRASMMFPEDLRDRDVAS